MKKLILLIFTTSLFILISTANATLYKWTDKNGQIHITDYPPPSEQFLPEAEQVETSKKEKSLIETPLEKKVQEQKRTEKTFSSKPQFPSKGVLRIPLPQQKVPEQKKSLKHEPKVKRYYPHHRVPAKKKLTQSQLMAILSFGGLFYTVLFIAISLFFYFYSSLVFHLIGKKRGVSYAWMVWIPIIGSFVGLFVLISSAERPWWWALFFILPFIISMIAHIMPVLAIATLILTVVALIILIVIWMDISLHLGLNKWLGLLMIIPFVNFIYMGYLAFKTEANIEINKKKMIITATAVYVALVVLSAVAVQYLLIPYLKSNIISSLTQQFKKDLPAPHPSSSERKNVRTKQLPNPQSMTPEAYDKVLQSKAPSFRNGSFVYAGPVALMIDHFWDDENSPHLWLKVRTPLFPNIKFSKVEVKIDQVFTKNNTNIYDPQNMFEQSEAFHRVHLFVKSQYAEGQRDIHLIKGSKKEMIKAIKGKVVFHLPLNLSLVEVPLRKGLKLNSNNTSIIVQGITPLKVSLLLKGRADLVEIVGHNSTGKTFSPTMIITTEKEEAKDIRMSFPEQPVKLSLVLRSGEYLKEYPFYLKVK